MGANHSGAAGGQISIRGGITLRLDNISRLCFDITGRVAVTLVQTAGVAAIFLDGAHSCGHHPNLQPVSLRFCAY